MSEKIKIQNKEVEIKKLPLGKYGELLKVLKHIPAQIGTLGGLNNDAIFAKLPEIIGESFPDVIEIIRIGSGLTEEEIQALSLNEAIDCVIAIGKVNQFADVWEKIKKAMAQYQVTKKIPETKTIGG